MFYLFKKSVFNVTLLPTLAYLPPHLYSEIKFGHIFKLPLLLFWTQPTPFWLITSLKMLLIIFFKCSMFFPPVTTKFRTHSSTYTLHSWALFYFFKISRNLWLLTLPVFLRCHTLFQTLLWSLLPLSQCFHIGMFKDYIVCYLLIRMYTPLSE